MVLVEESAEQVASMHPAWLTVADDPQVGGWTRRLQSERPVGTVVVVVGDVDLEHLLKVPAAHDEQPVQALGPDRPDPALGVGVGVGRLHRRHKRLGSLRREDVVEGAGELRIPIADEEPPAAEFQASAVGYGLVEQPKPHPGGRSRQPSKPVEYPVR
jgi:hypothetical protein